MILEKEKVFQTIYDSMDAIFVADTASDRYEIIKDGGKFTGIFGKEGSYKDMMIKFMEGTIDKRVSEGGVYSVFFDKASGFVGRISKKAKMHYKGEDFYFQFNNLPVDETRNIILITYIDEDAYFTESRGDVKTQAMKSAYLFSMFVDLVEDTCSNMDMSEIDNDPVNSLRITYSQWREQIVNMIDEHQRDEFMRFTDIEYLKNNVESKKAKSREFFMMNLEGNFKWVNLIFSRIDTGYENDHKMVFVVEDNSEAHDRTTKGLENELEKYQKLSKHDSLTGLLNHGNIEKVLADCLSAKPLSLIMLDIDHFKKVNDTFGHAAGDDYMFVIPQKVNSWEYAKRLLAIKWKRFLRRSEKLLKTRNLKQSDILPAVSALSKYLTVRAQRKRSNDSMQLYTKPRKPAETRS